MKANKGKTAVRDNVMAMGQKFFEENVSTVLTEATLRGYNILDCVVVVTFFLSPPFIKVERIEDYFASHPNPEKARHYRSQSQMNGQSLGFFFSLSDGSHVQHVMLFQRNWTEMQANVRDQLAQQLESFETSPELREKALADAQKMYKL